MSRRRGFSKKRRFLQFSIAASKNFIYNSWWCYNSTLKTVRPKKYHIFGKLRRKLSHGTPLDRVVYLTILSKIHDLISVVVHSSAELISQVKSVNLPVWAFSSTFLYEFTMVLIDIHQKMPISLFKTLFHHFHFYPFVKLIWWVTLNLCHI